MRSDLDSLLDRIMNLLLHDPGSATTGRDLGAELATVTCNRPEILGQTLQILSRQLLTEFAPAEQRTIKPVLGSLLGHIALGFAGQAQNLIPACDEEEKLRPTERRFFTTMLDMVDGLIVVLDSEGNFAGFNRASESVSGYSFEEIHGRHYTFLVAPEEHESAKALVSHLRELTPNETLVIPYESVWLTRDGERRQIKWSTTVVHEQGGNNYLIATGMDVTEKRLTEMELTEALKQVAQVKEAERLRLAQDLHDDAVQQLLGLSYQLAEMQRRATEKSRWSPEQRLEELVPGIEVVRSDIITVAQNLRRLISSLRPPGLREMGLAEILEVYVANWQQGAGRNGPVVNMDLSALRGKQVPEGRQLPEAVATCVFRLVQEAIWNAHKHAAANRITVSVRHTRAEVVLHVKDDGCGFTIPRHLFQFAAGGRFGFLGMQERIHAVDGILSIWSEPGQGTEIQARIPLKNAKDDYGVSNSGAAGG